MYFTSFEYRSLFVIEMTLWADCFSIKILCHKYHYILEIRANKTHQWFTLMDDAHIFTLKTQVDIFR
jgi:hypothetical protein